MPTGPNALAWSLELRRKFGNLRYILAGYGIKFSRFMVEWIASHPDVKRYNTATMNSKQLRSYVFVVVQFACLIAIALTGPLIARNPLWLALEAAALGLGLWTMWTMRSARFNIVPDVPANSRLVTHGPYRFIRHPMYATLLLGSLALVLNSPTPLRAALWLVLMVDLVVKLNYEERLLVQSFPDYVVYQKTSKRLVPLIY